MEPTYVFDIPSSTSLSNSPSIESELRIMAGDHAAETITTRVEKNWSTELEFKLHREAIDLREQLAEMEPDTEEVDKIRNQLRTKEFKIDLLPRIHSRIRQKVLESDDLDHIIKIDDQNQSSVLAIDMRKSSAMMLKTTPEKYFTFIWSLIRRFSDIIKKNFGIFDKFTGDGILAYFPRAFSGDDTILHTIKAAQECQKCFERSLEKANNIFEALLDDFGLCAGIDYGLIYLTIIDARINIVGSPIVYACRMSDYEKNCVVINIKAKTELDNKPNHGIVLKRETIDAKPHEGSLVGYSVKTDISSVDYAEPSWFL